MVSDNGQRVDFFISHAGADRAWAEWVAWQLEDAGYTTELDHWDWAPGENFVLKMNQALDGGGRMVALFSAAYFEPERFTTDEWTAIVAAKDKMVPIRLDTAKAPSILGPIITASIQNMDADAAHTALLEAVRKALGERGRPHQEPGFPGPGGSGHLRRLGATGPRLPGTLPGVWNIPNRNASFTGRDKLLVQLRADLTTGSTVAVQALHGRGGVGKTQLAIEYAHRFANEYELAWWIRAEEPALIGEQLADLATRIGAAPADATPAEAWDALATELRTRARWLLIFDNAEGPAALRPYLPGGTGHILITSRDPRWQTYAVPLDIGVFTRDESITLLQDRVPTLTRAEADQLADDLDDLPLALVQAAATLTDGLPLAQYRRLLAEHISALLEENRPDDYPFSLAAQTRLSSQRLAQESPQAAALLNACALLAAEPFPLHTCTTTPAEDTPEPIAALLRDPLAATRAMGALARHALARIQDGTLQLHRLTQSLVRDQLDDGQHAQAARGAQALLTAANPGNATEPATWPRWRDITPHLLAIDPRAITTETARDVVRDACWYLIDLGDARSALPRLEELHHVWGAQLGPDHEGTLWTANYLAMAYGSTGDAPRARDLDQDTYDRRRRLVGNDHPDTLSAAHYLAARLAALGETEAARNLSQDTLDRRRRVLGNDHPSTLATANNLAIHLATLGETEAARNLDQDTYDRRRRLVGDDHPDTLNAAHNLAADLATLGETEAARNLAQDTYDRRRRVLGDDHPSTLATANNLAIRLATLGETEAARNLAQDTYDRYRRVLGDDHRHTLSAAHNLAADLATLGETEAARNLAQDTYDRRRRVLGDDHPDTLNTAKNLATAAKAASDTIE
ncbi:FxSxx-COOH system tetratricopeptide repeat protein [Kitasatospora sp. NBC_00374]|uniref:FxSxx-COOH system tetratricopeptide repeat protein n=1 Tax=Kitasatospora sp. NBC_00374 TaxID=2975964 RepID=UPI0032455102